MPLGLLDLLQIPHFKRSRELKAVVKVLLSCVHDGYFWLDRKIDLNVDAIHRITCLSKVGVDPFVGKNLYRKIDAKLTKDFNLSKRTKAYGATDIQDQELRFTVQLLARRVLKKC